MGGVLGFKRQRDLPVATMPRRRGIIATRTNAHFRVQADGTTLFYPQGEYGRCGFVIASDEQEATLRARARRLQVTLYSAQILLAVAIPAILVWREPLDLSSLLWKMGVAFPLLVLLEWAVHRAYFRRLTAQMQSIRVANSPLAHLRAAGQTMNPLVLFLSAMFFLAFSALAFLFFIFQSGDVGLLMVSLLYLVFAVIQGIPLQSWWTGSR